MDRFNKLSLITTIMSHVQPKFNAKARHSTAGSRKKGKPKRRREEDEPSPVEEDPNASILVPKSKESKEAERKERLRQEVHVRCLVS